MFQDSIGKGPDDVVHEAGDVVPLPPDGGWGWVVCLGKYIFIKTMKKNYNPGNTIYVSSIV